MPGQCTLVQDAIEEIQVQAGGYSAEFGGANAGIIQQQLKSGTSQWKASLQYHHGQRHVEAEEQRP